MARFCSKCGKELNEKDIFCSDCGQRVEKESRAVGMPSIPRRDIVISVILSILTCGIYGLYWLIVLTDEVNAVSDDYTTSGAMSVLFILLTCGLYSFYWAYRMGKNLYKAGCNYNIDIPDNSVIYLLFTILGGGIINYCLIQSELNKFAK